MGQMSRLTLPFQAPDSYRPGMSDDLKAISLRLPPALLKQVTAAAKDAHLDRTSWIRLALTEKLAGPDPSRNQDLIDSVEVKDERARQVIKDLIRRVEALENAKGGLDPFA